MPGWEKLIVCTGSTADPCGFPQLITLINALITDLFILSTFLATAVFIFAGFKLLTSQGNPAALTAAKKMLGSVVKGYIVILLAWLVIYTITNTLLSAEYKDTSLLIK